MLVEQIRAQIRRSKLWVSLQRTRREGWINALVRRKYQDLILRTAPVYTPPQGEREVHILTWDKDWKNAVWALKTFFHHSRASFPLHIHDGGLDPMQIRELRKHFPGAFIWTKADADGLVEKKLGELGLERSLAYRKTNVASRKLFDFFLLGESPTLLSVDSDIVFFLRPEELLAPFERNLFNRDLGYAYSLPLAELRSSFGIDAPPLINSGLSLTKRMCVDFRQIEVWLGHEGLYSDRWVTEQTLQALAFTPHGIGFLPSSYHVDTKPGIPEGSICKHYPGFFRPLLYSEGMRRLAEDSSFLELARGNHVTTRF